MNSFSTTQASNIAAFVGLVVLILNHFHVNIGSDEVSAFVGAVITLGGIVVSWVNRYQQGDLTVAGFRKPTGV
jgi:hypothetical protein